MRRPVSSLRCSQSRSSLCRLRNGSGIRGRCWGRARDVVHDEPQLGFDARSASCACSARGCRSSARTRRAPRPRRPRPARPVSSSSGSRRSRPAPAVRTRSTRLRARARASPVRSGRSRGRPHQPAELGDLLRRQAELLGESPSTSWQCSSRSMYATGAGTPSMIARSCDSRAASASCASFKSLMSWPTTYSPFTVPSKLRWARSARGTSAGDRWRRPPRARR